MTTTAMKNEVLCKLLCHNICCLIMSQFELGIEPVFWGDAPKAAGQAPCKADTVIDAVPVESVAPVSKAAPARHIYACVGA